jgi:NAD(P)-dependent dehydrogenase (short-subunit alcohol dehydrogenase family)
VSSLQGKVALVTGGSSGIGLAVARGLLREGAKVAVAGRSEAKLTEASRSLAGGDRLLHHAADVSDVAAVQALVKRVTDHWGRIDILVNNAGTNLKERTFRELTRNAGNC